MILNILIIGLMILTIVLLNSRNERVEIESEYIENLNLAMNVVNEYIEELVEIESEYIENLNLAMNVVNEYIEELDKQIKLLQKYNNKLEEDLNERD